MFFDRDDGSQVAFIQDDNFISQTLTVASGTHTLTFKAAQATGNKAPQIVLVKLRSSTTAATIKTFVWCGNRICEERDASGATVTKRFFPEGEQRVGGSDAGSYYYSRDHLRSIREVTDSSGAVKTRYDYDAWGNAVVVSGNMSFDFGYTGHFYHQPSGLNLSMHRAYSPTLGRWVSRDPLNNAEVRQGSNLYVYVNTDPANAVDPLGLDAFVYNTGGLTGHTAFVLTDPSGGVRIYHQYAAGHMAGSSWSSSLRGIVYDKSVVWYQDAPSITQWLADERRAGNDFSFEASYPGSTLPDQLVMSQLDDLANTGDIPYSYVGGENCHNFAYDALINYARTEAIIRRQK